MPTHLLAATATTTTPFWQSSAGGIVIGIVLTMLGNFVLQLLTERRTSHRELRAARAAAHARWVAVQIETILDLQEQLELVASYIGNAMASGPIERLRTRPMEYFPLLTANGRAGMLCSRLEDEGLRTRIRTYLRENREYVTTSGARLGDAEMMRLREERISIIDGLGTLLRRYHDAEQPNRAQGGS